VNERELAVNQDINEEPNNDLFEVMSLAG